MGPLIPFLARMVPALVGTGESAGLMGALRGAMGGGEAAQLAQHVGVAENAHKAFDLDAAINEFQQQLWAGDRLREKTAGRFVGPLPQEEMQQFGYQLDVGKNAAQPGQPAPGSPAVPAVPLSPPATPPGSPPAPPASPSPPPPDPPRPPRFNLQPVPLPKSWNGTIPMSPAAPPPGNTLPPAPPTGNSPGDRFADLLQKAPGGLAQILAALHAAQAGLEAFAKSVVDGNRYLGQWNGNIASSFAEGRFREQQREMDLADSTENSTVALNESFQDLLDETHEIRETGARLLNTVGIVAAHMSKILAIAIKLSPHFTVTEWLLRQIEEHLGQNNPGQDLIDQFQDAAIRAGQPRPQAPAPGAPPAPQRPKWVDPMGQDQNNQRIRRAMGGG